MPETFGDMANRSAQKQALRAQQRIADQLERMVDTMQAAMDLETGRQSEVLESDVYDIEVIAVGGYNWIGELLRLGKEGYSIRGAAGSDYVLLQRHSIRGAVEEGGE